MKVSISPAVQSIRFSFSNLKFRKATIRIFDLMGRMLVYHTNQSKHEVILPVNRSGFVLVKVDDLEESFTKLGAVN